MEKNRNTDIDLYDEKVEKALSKPPIFNFYYSYQEYGLDIVEFSSLGFSDHLTEILNLYEKARVNYYTKESRFVDDFFQRLKDMFV